MQTCFFAISGVLPREEAFEAIKHTIEEDYGKRGSTPLMAKKQGLHDGVDAPPMPVSLAPRNRR